VNKRSQGFDHVVRRAPRDRMTLTVDLDLSMSKLHHQIHLSRQVVLRRRCVRPIESVILHETDRQTDRQADKQTDRKSETERRVRGTVGGVQ